MRGYAYFILGKGQKLTRKAHERLDVLTEINELNSGFQIAMRDLHIRGTGNILGAEQSGHMATVGVELYSRILKQAIKQTSEQRSAPDNKETPSRLVDLSLNVNAYIPITYIEDLSQRFNVYRQIAGAKQSKAVDKLSVALRDRYGRLPKEVSVSLKIAKLRIVASDAGIVKIKGDDTQYVFSFLDAFGSVSKALSNTLQKLHPDIAVSQRRIVIQLDAGAEDGKNLDKLIAIVKHIIAFRERILASLNSATARPVSKR